MSGRRRIIVPNSRKPLFRKPANLDEVIPSEALFDVVDKTQFDFYKTSRRIGIADRIDIVLRDRLPEILRNIKTSDEGFWAADYLASRIEPDYRHNTKREVSERLSGIRLSFAHRAFKSAGYEIDYTTLRNHGINHGFVNSAPRKTTISLGGMLALSPFLRQRNRLVFHTDASGHRIKLDRRGKPRRRLTAFQAARKLGLTVNTVFDAGRIVDHRIETSRGRKLRFVTPPLHNFVVVHPDDEGFVNSLVPVYARKKGLQAELGIRSSSTMAHYLKITQALPEGLAVRPFYVGRNPYFTPADAEKFRAHYRLLSSGVPIAALKHGEEVRNWHPVFKYSGWPAAPLSEVLSLPVETLTNLWRYTGSNFPRHLVIRHSHSMPFAIEERDIPAVREWLKTVPQGNLPPATLAELYPKKAQHYRGLVAVSSIERRSLDRQTVRDLALELKKEGAKIHWHAGKMYLSGQYAERLGRIIGHWHEAKKRYGRYPPRKALHNWETVRGWHPLFAGSKFEAPSVQELSGATRWEITKALRDKSAGLSRHLFRPGKPFVALVAPGDLETVLGIIEKKKKRKTKTE